MSEFLVFENVTKRFGSLTAVDNASLEVQRGEFYSLVNNYAAALFNYYVADFRGNKLDIISTTKQGKFTVIQSAIKDRFWVKVNEAQELYPEFITDARKTLGKAFKEEDFPSVRQFRRLFDYDVKFLPVPKIDDWRLTGIGGGDMEKGEEIFGAAIPMKRMGTADELAAAICFFLSDDASFVTGQTLIVDGGETIS